eukprot:2255294-Rhodomonas_salina.1
MAPATRGVHVYPGTRVPGYEGTRAPGTRSFQGSFYLEIRFETLQIRRVLKIARDPVHRHNGRAGRRYRFVVLAHLVRGCCEWHKFCFSTRQRSAAVRFADRNS